MKGHLTDGYYIIWGCLVQRPNAIYAFINMHRMSQTHIIVLPLCLATVCVNYFYSLTTSAYSLMRSINIKVSKQLWFFGKTNVFKFNFNVYTKTANLYHQPFRTKELSSSDSVFCMDTFSSLI